MALGIQIKRIAGFFTMRLYFAGPGYRKEILTIMTIEKDGREFFVYCDICGETAREFFDTFQDAVDFKKENSWKSRAEKGEWLDICPECQGVK